ncbi:hypothetical protein K402DRAFT_326266, partial [Aulographum hederae CBS 113979]
STSSSSASSPTILVPMISTIQTRTLRDLVPFTTPAPYTRTITARKMTRARYDAHYAIDADGNYIGTGTRAVDGGLVYCPKNSGGQEDLRRQVEQMVKQSGDHWVWAGAGFSKGSGRGDFAVAHMV